MNNNLTDTAENKCNNSKAVNMLLLIVEVITVILNVTWEIIASICRLVLPAYEKSVKGEIVMITGTGHGLGRELALQYASHGATIACLDVNEENNKETVAMVNALGYSKAHAYTCDVKDYANVHAVVDDIQREIGNVTILINNAGIMPTYPFNKHTKEQIEQIIATIKAVLPSMLKNNSGHIVSISSLCGLEGMANLVPYCASKFAVRGLMSGLRKELDFYKHDEIETTTIYPYIIDTGLAKRPIIRFPKIAPIIKPCDAAKLVIQSQRRNVLERTIPKDFEVVIAVLNILPYKAGKVIERFMNTYIESN